MSKNELVYESIGLFILSLGMFLYMKKSNPDNVIGRYYQGNSPFLYSVFNMNMMIVKITMLFNLKFLGALLWQKYF